MGYLDKQIHRSENVRLNQAPADLHKRPTQNCVPDIAKPRNHYRALQVELPPRPPVQYQPRRHWNVDRISYENGTCTIDENAIVHEVSNPIAADNGFLSSNTHSRNLSYHDRSPRTPREHPIENQSFSGTPRDTEWTHLPKRSGFYSERKSSCRTANHRIPPPSSMKDAATIDGKNPADTLVDLQNAIDRHRRQTYSPKEHVMVDLMKSSSSFPEHVAVNEKMQLAVSPVEHVNILGEYSLHRVNAWSGDRSSSGSNSYGGLVRIPSSTGLQRGSSGSSFADSLYSSDFPLTNYSPSLSPNVADSAFFNAFHEEEWKYDDTRQCGESEKNWAQQTEESYNLQLTLALRLTAEASLAEDLHFLGRHVQATPNISCTGSATKSAVALSHRFWINGSLSYYDKIQDGFYHICGLNPYVWTMCNNVEESGQMPSLESLRSVDASDSPIEVVLIDKQGDSQWRELEIKALGLASRCSSTEVVVKQLGKLVCMLMGGPYSTEHGDLKTRWQVTSKMLKDCLRSVVLPIGSISVGLCRHRALLFKALADIIDLPCRIAQGCKYCGMSDGSSCLIQCGLDRECLVDLIGKPGELCDSYMKDIISGSIASPLRLPESKPLHVTNEVRSLARQYASDNKSLGGLLNVPSSRQVAGPMEDGTRVSFAASLNHIDTVPVVSSCITCTGTEACAECSNATNFAGNLSVQNVAFLHLKEELRGTVDENEASHECIIPTGTNDTKYNNLPDLCPHVDGEKANILVDTKSNNDHFLQRPVQVNKKDDLHAKTNKDSFDHKCLEVHKHRIEHGKNGDTECLQDTVLQSYKHIDEQSKLKDCLHRNNDKRLEEAGCLLQNRSTLELSLAMDGLEIPWEDLILKERIGAGSFGTVHHADWHGSDVAVKILIDQEIHEERLKEFLREVAIMKRLRHPNIVLFMGAVTKHPNLSIVTEYLPRGSLYRIIHRAGARELLDERRRLRMALDVAKGINYLHRLNPPIVHRDLKSPNLLVDKTWTVKVCDFGLSRLKANTFISSKSAAGTPEWMAPEVLRDEPSNEKSDVYSFGVILWELVTLQQPWSGLSPAQVVGAVGFQNRRLPIPEDMNPAIASIIESCWANDPRQRLSFSCIMDSLKPLVKSPSM